jgi:hypothetical protein
MQCPRCGALAMPTDPVCPGCRRRLGGRGPLTRSQIANGTALLFGLIMLSFLTMYVHPRVEVSMAAHLTTALFCAFAAGVGRMVGWVIGAFAPE